jgi:hypothetical protein
MIVRKFLSKIIKELSLLGGLHLQWLQLYEVFNLALDIKVLQFESFLLYFKNLNYNRKYILNNL